MFARINKKTLQYLGLAGALVFTMSTLPGLEDASETTSASRSEAVESGSSMDCSGLGRRDYDFCILNGTGDLSHITAEVTLRKVEDQERDSKDPRKFNPTEEFEVEMRTLCKKMDGDCQEKTSVLRVPLAEHRQLVAKTREQFRNDAKVVAEAKTAAAKRRQDEFECKTPEGKNVDNLVDCRIKQLRRVDEAKQAAYFQAHVLPEIKSLLSKSNPADQEKGMRLLQAYAEAGLGNEYINETIETHRQFGFFNRTYTQDKLMLENLARQNPFNPQLAQAYENAQNNRRQAEAYFYSRGLQLPQTWDLGGNNVGGWMQNDVSSMRQIVSDHYAMTMNQYQYGTNQMLTNNLVNGWNQQTRQGVVAANQNTFNGQMPMNAQQQQAWTQQQLQQNQMQPVQYQNGYPVPPMGQQRMANANPQLNQPIPQNAFSSQQGQPVFQQQPVRSINPRSARAPLR